MVVHFVMCIYFFFSKKVFLNEVWHEVMRTKKYKNDVLYVQWKIIVFHKVVQLGYVGLTYF